MLSEIDADEPKTESEIVVIAEDLKKKFTSETDQTKMLLQVPFINLYYLICFVVGFCRAVDHCVNLFQFYYAMVLYILIFKINVRDFAVFPSDLESD